MILCVYICRKVGVCMCMVTCVCMSELQIGTVLDVNRGFKQVCRESILSLIYTKYISVSTFEMKANQVSHD